MCVYQLSKKFMSDSQTNLSAAVKAEHKLPSGAPIEMAP